MKLFIKIYAEDFDSACSTIPFTIKHALPFEITLADLKEEIERQITQPQVFRRKNQLISIMKGDDEEMVLLADDSDTKILEDLGIVQGSIIHLQDAKLANPKQNKEEIDWAKLASPNQIDSSSDMTHIDHMLMKFIEHHQVFEFIQIFKVYLKNGDNQSFSTQDSLGGKTFLHLAIEHSATQIASYLLLDAKVDPNVLSHNQQMGVLHVAVNFQRNDMIDLILMSKSVDINLMSSLHGTPLHLACKIGNLKIVQRLLINGADITLKSQKNLKLAKDSTDNQRVKFLIEKYEKLRALELESAQSMGSSSDEEEPSLFNNIFNFKRSNDSPKLKASDFQDEQEEYLLDDIERTAGSALDQAQIYIEDFQKSRIEILPSVMGNLYAQGNLNKKQLMRYFKIQADQGVIIKFESEKHYQNQNKKLGNLMSLNKKQLIKNKIELIQLKKIISLNHSFRDEFTKEKNQHCLELYYDNEQILYLACYDSDQLKQWQQYIKKAMLFHEWFSNLKDFLTKNQDKLTEQYTFKLNEIIQFADQYSLIEKVEIKFIPKEIAAVNDKKQYLLKLQELLRHKSEPSSSGDEEFKTPEGSFEGEQGSMSPVASQSLSQNERLQKKQQMILDGKLVCFKDFDFLEVIGEGSFGRVFKCKKRDNGAIYAMKVMKKQYLISNHQIKYAVSEAQIMKTFDHPYLLKLIYTFQTPSNLYMAIEYCENGDLSQILDEYSLFEEKTAKFLVAELILGIQCLHEKGILFRDLKPENILLDSECHIRLADFGLAKQGKEGQDIRAQSFCGSPAYLAPEMLKKEGVTKAGDVYQVGVVLYEMLVGIPPYYNDNIKILYQNIEKGKLKIPKYLSAEAKKCLLKMLNRNPSKRPMMDQLMKEPFFASIDWDKLAKKQIDPPVILRKSQKQNIEMQQHEDELAMLFENTQSINDDEQRGGGQKCIFSDEDYKEENRTYNRVKNYSFSRI